MSIYKNPLNYDDILNLKVNIITNEIFENFHFKNLKGDKTLNIHLLPPDSSQHGPRYKIMLGNNKDLTYITKRPEGEIIGMKISADKKLGKDYYELVKALVMTTYDGALEYFNNDNKDLIDKREEEFNALSTSEKKSLIKEYDKKFL